MEIETAIDSGKGTEICQAQRDVSHKYWSFLIRSCYFHIKHALQYCKHKIHHYHSMSMKWIDVYNKSTWYLSTLHVPFIKSYKVITPIHMSCWCAIHRNPSYTSSAMVWSKFWKSKSERCGCLADTKNILSRGPQWTKVDVNRRGPKGPICNLGTGAKEGKTDGTKSYFQANKKQPLI